MLEVVDVVHDCMLAEYSNLLSVEEYNNTFEINETFDINDLQENWGGCLESDELPSLSETIDEVNTEFNNLDEGEFFNDNDFNLF